MTAYNMHVFELAKQQYLPQEMHFLSKHSQETCLKKSYQGLKILQNIPLTISAVLKIEPLILGGADVTVSCLGSIAPQKEALDILAAANVTVHQGDEFQDEYDFTLDCCAELIDKVRPKYGAVELTQTGSVKYKNSQLPYPIVSIDDSNLKLLETLFGTGDGFIRGLRKSVGRNLDNKKFLVFGYGKVGRGIVQSLLKFTDDIVLVDITEESKRSAQLKSLQFVDGKSISEVRKALMDVNFAVTATGVKHILTDYYHLAKKDFPKAILANMGADDEFGANFKEEEVLFGKKPLNFLLEEPTLMKYLDPIFDAHNMGIDLILSGEMKNGLNPFPDHLANDIIEEWSRVYKSEAFSVEAYLN